MPKNGSRGLWWHRLHKNLRGAGKPGELTCDQPEVPILTCLIMNDRRLILIHNGWMCRDRTKTLGDIILQYTIAMHILLWDDRRHVWWNWGRRHRYHRGRPDIFRLFWIKLRLLLARLLLLFIFLPDRLHYVSNQSLLILRTLTFIESDYDPLNPHLGRRRTLLDGKLFSFHLVLVLLLID